MGIEYGEKRSTFIDYGRPSLFLDFAKRKSLVDAISKNNLITFTRSSTGTYVGSDGLIKTAAADEARFDHNPETGESLGLLIEGQRTNLITYSENFVGNYALSNVTLNANSTISPSGNSDATTVTADITNSTGVEYYTSFSNLVNYTISLFVKRKSGSNSFVIRSAGGGTSRIQATFSLENETSSEAEETTSSSIISYPNGWFKCSVSGPVSSDENRIIFLNSMALNEEFYIWGAQIEQGSFPTSYIPTSGSAVTRQPDNAQITGTNFTDWYNATEGTIFTEFSAKTNTTGYPGVYWFNNNLTVSRGFALVKETSPQTRVFQRGDDGVLKRVSFSENIPDSTFAKASVFYTNSEIGGSQNNAFQSPTSITSPYSVNRLYIGYHNSGGGVAPLHLNSHIKQLLYYPTRLTNTQLQALTQ